MKFKVGDNVILESSLHKKYVGKTFKVHKILNRRDKVKLKEENPKWDFEVKEKLLEIHGEKLDESFIVKTKQLKLNNMESKKVKDVRAKKMESKKVKKVRAKKVIAKKEVKVKKTLAEKIAEKQKKFLTRHDRIAKNEYNRQIKSDKKRVETLEKKLKLALEVLNAHIKEMEMWEQTTLK